MALVIWIISRLLHRPSDDNFPPIVFRPSDKAQQHQPLKGTLPNKPLLPFDACFDEAVTKRKRIWIEYLDSDQSITQRKIEVYFPKDKIYVFAWCCLRNEPRTFKRDGILRWQLLDEVFNDDPLVERYIRQECLRHDWKNKVPWPEWAASHRRTKQDWSPERAKIAPKSSPARTATDETFWVTPDKTVSVQQYVIPGGGVYVGSGLASVSGLRPTEPALIDPQLPLNRIRADKKGVNVPYWPSYAELSPEARAGYLEWLVSSRQDPDVHVCYPFLFFYGFERRAFRSGDPWTHSANELKFMQREVRTLLKTYGNINSFHEYASSFLDILDTVLDKDVLHIRAAPDESKGNELPLSLQVVISQFAAAGTHLPAHWALSWVLCHPETRLRTPARRCLNELRELFRLRYRKEFGQGLKLRPGTRKLTHRYHPASPTFGKDLEFTHPFNDIYETSTIPRKLIDLLVRCTDELDPYSRWIADSANSQKDIMKFALLPSDLITNHQEARSLQLREWLNSQVNGQDMRCLESGQLFSQLQIASTEKLSKNQAVMVAQLLEKFGYGIEPDVRFGGAVLQRDSKAVIFRCEEDSGNTSSPEYSVATLLLHVGSIVAMADGVLNTDEEKRLESQLEVVLHLKESERRRLRGHLQWLLLEPRSFTGLEKRVRSLDAVQKKNIGQFVISLAGADGRIDTEEMKALEKIYDLLGLERDRLYTDLHGLSIPSDTEPCVVQKAESVLNHYRIPQPNRRSQTVGFTLDMAKVTAKLAETASVSVLLGGIFSSDDGESPHMQQRHCVGKLDSRHSAFVLALIEKDRWDRSEIEVLAMKNGLMTEGALEKINDAAFELGNQPIWEGEDFIEINVPFAREILK